MRGFIWQWALVGQVAGLLAALFGGAWWVLDLANHVAPWSAALAAAGLLAAAWSRRAVPGAVLAIATLWGLWRVAPRLGGAAPDGGREVRLFLSNVETRNPDHRAVVDAILRSDPDVIALLEVDARWLVDLDALRAGWPHFLEAPRPDNFGVALYSRIPLDDARVVYPGGAAVPSIRARLGDVDLVVTHPPPPVGARYTAARDAQLAALGGELADRTVLMGDLNATPWSAAFPVGGAGWRPGTWPAPWPAALRIPIDHVLVGRAIHLARLAVGPDIGSDHRPVVADLVLPPAGPSPR